jgi:hypothetical protein
MHCIFIFLIVAPTFGHVKLYPLLQKGSLVVPLATTVVIRFVIYLDVVTIEYTQ